MEGAPPPVQSRVPPALVAWARRQERPFGSADLPDEYRDSSPDLATHPEFVRVGDRFWTARMLAASTPFIVRLDEVETRHSLLLPGHRFIPFAPAELPPQALRISLPDGNLLVPRPLRIDRSVVLRERRLLPHPPRDPDAKHVFAFSIPMKYLQGAYVLRCLSHADSLFEIATNVRTTMTAAGREALTRHLRQVIQSPPPGPCTAARQLLAAASAMATEAPGVALGPLADLALAVSGVQLVGGTHGPALSLGHEAAPPAGAPTVEDELLRRIEALRPRRRERDVSRMSWSEPVWNVDGLTLLADGRDDRAYIRCVLSFGGSSPRVDCGCWGFHSSRSCAHVAAFLDFLRNALAPGTQLGDLVRADLARPAWSRSLDRFAAFLRPPKEAPRAAQRLVWRVGLDDSWRFLEPVVQTLGRSGKWTQGRRIGLGNLASSVREPADEDRPLIEYLEQVVRHLWSHELDAYEVFNLLIGHPRVEDSGTREPIEIRRSIASLRLGAAKGGWKLVPGCADDEKAVPRWQGRRGVVLRRGSTLFVAPLTAAARRAFEGIESVLPGVLPAEALPELLSKLPEIERAVPVGLPESLKGEERPADSLVRVRLAPLQPEGLAVRLLVRPVPSEANEHPPGEGPAATTTVSESRRVRVVRNLEVERAVAAAVAEHAGLTARVPREPWHWEIDGDDDALDVVARLQNGLPVGAVAEWPDDASKLTVLREAAPKDLRVEVRDRNDWFEIDGTLDVDGATVALSEVLAMLRRGRRWIMVGARRWARISDLFRQRLASLGDLLHGGQGNEISRAAVPFAAEALSEAGVLKASEAWSTAGRRFEEAMALRPDPPAAFTAELRDYQLDGYRWLRRLAAWGVGGCLADDMGLGKTIQALAVLVDRASSGPALVVAPTSVASNWVRESRRFAPTLAPILYRETDRQAGSSSFGPGDVVVASYGLVQRDAARLATVPWSTMILDEAQFVKNAATKTAASLRAIPAVWRLALTGTPLENHLGELWSLFRAVSPGLLGSWERFRQRFAAPIEKDGDASRRQALARLVRPFILRRTKSEVLTELPPRTEVTLEATPSPAERKLYDDVRLAAVAALAGAGDGEDARFAVLAALTRLRQAACHPRLLKADWKEDSAKVKLLLETLEELREGRHRALVFSQFTSFLDLLEPALRSRGFTFRRLDGSTPAAERDRAISAFQAGEGDCFLISLKAGGTGLNLTAADYVIHLDPWWNPAVEDQATGRAHRIGQSRPVTVYRLVCAGSIEQKILALHASKRDLVEGVLEGADGATRLSVAELAELLRQA